MFQDEREETMSIIGVFILVSMNVMGVVILVSMGIMGDIGRGYSCE